MLKANQFCGSIGTMSGRLAMATVPKVFAMACACLCNSLIYVVAVLGLGLHGILANFQTFSNVEKHKILEQ